MNYALITDEIPVEIGTSNIVTATGQFTYATMLLWSDAERAAFGIFPITDDVIPDNKVPTGSSLSLADGVVTRSFTLADAPPPPVPSEVTRRQLLTGLAMVDWITEEEALDALATGARPASVQALISMLPEGERFAVIMKWIGFQTAYRTDPMVHGLAELEEKTSEEIDDFFRLCAGIA